MEHDRLLPDVHSVNDHAVRPWRLSADRSGRDMLIALTKQAMGMVIFSCSLGLWAAVWTVAASLASAWLQ